MRTVTTAETLKVIRTANAFVKNIETVNPSAEPAFDDPKNSWGFLVRQLKDPENYRPARHIPDGVDQTRFYDPSDGQWYQRSVKPIKGMPKPGAKFTKKTAVSLLPPDGRMTLFSQDNGIVLVFNSAQCHVKQYIFDHNVVSNNRWWLHQPNPAKRVSVLQRSTTLDAIRESHRNARRRNITPEWNEILPGLSADAVIGVAVPKNDPTRRLNAQYRRLLLKRELNIDVPLLIMTPEVNVHEYTEAMQLEDLANAKVSSSIQRDFFNAITALDPTLVAKLPIDIFQTIRDHDIAMINIALTQHPEDVKKIKNGKTPIQLAAELGYWDCVEAIAKAVKTDESDTAKYGYALLYAAKANQIDAVIALLDAGAPSTFHMRYTKTYPIHYAVKHKNSIMLNAILQKHPGDLKHKNKDNQTPFLLALYLGYTDIADEIFRRDGEEQEYIKRWEIWCDKEDEHSTIIGAFSREMIAIKEKETTRKEILQLQRDLVNQIRILNSEIASKNTNTKTPSFFKKMTEKLSGDVKKEEKLRALSEALQLINDQISTEGTASQAAKDVFNKALRDNPRWKDGLRSKRTAQLIDRTLELMDKTFVKARHEQSAVAQNSIPPLLAPHVSLFATKAASEKTRMREEDALLQTTLNALRVPQQSIERNEIPDRVLVPN